MMRSLYSGVSGLQNHQTRMDVIGNNISNVNTTGFKRGRVNFQDMISQMMQGPARPGERVGGVNPQQVGLGMQVATIDTLHTQGSLQTTGVKSDLAIQGEGFFMLRAGDENYYTRAGAFGLDAQGNLVNPASGMRVQGWQAQTVDGQTMVNTSARVEDLVIPVGSKDPAQATSQVFLASNLNKNTPLIPEDATDAQILDGTWTAEYDIYDSFGNTHTLRIDFTRNPDAENQWIATTTLGPEGDEVIPQQLSVGGVDSVDGATFIIEFSNDGTLQSVQNAEGGLMNDDDLGVQVTFEVPRSSIPLDPETGLPVDEVQLQTFDLNLGRAGAFVDSMTQYASESSTKVFNQNGFTMGYLEDYRIDQSGIITGIYSNGNNRSLGQVALASFTNPGGLEKTGETNFQVSINSGLPDIAPVGVAGKGTVIAGALEMSNVDLSEQFTDMIVTQRGFQANSKTIQTADQLLQEVLTLKR
ncbi:flagellar hook protein FlgE [Alkalispirochaeta americana]|uniref:Flagellar hook protein FlgE n=1 Tax=Alkalispirochaeta americana TaxID=159291 RepID=A0A1N6PLT5_9SPIO|nr:flagellar hook protein FlgE [Alkalispirochaeta americana]SIQ05266.1 flagellar hook protein FlgE [Alkalispirochaeta americana]